jgi:uroporphyrinogen decarboxylase
MSTDLENFRATVAHRRPARILYHAHYTPDLRARIVQHLGTEDITAHYGMVESIELSGALKNTPTTPDFSAYWKNELDKLPPGTFINGIGVAEVPSGFYHFTGYVSPLRNARSLRDLEAYPIPDYRNVDDSSLKVAVEEAHRAGRIVSAWVGHMYETAWQIRGYEEFLTDMLDQPAWAECLLDRLMEQNLIRARMFARAGADQITTGDDVASQKNLMFAPELWRKMMFSRWAKVWRAIKDINPNARIWYHSDGNVLDIIPDMIDAGLDILNPVQPECMDLDEVHRRFGRNLTFDGCVGTQSTMPWGTPEDVRRCVKTLIERYGRDGGLIVSPTHILEPEVPIANIEAMCQACRDFGTFE